jgi:DNA-binding PadR family transcriptional regulator
MERMADRGLVSSFTADATPERGGRRRKVYRLSPDGERTLARSYRQVHRLAQGLEERLVDGTVEG